MCTPAAEREHRRDVRTQRVADHQELRGLDVELLQQACVRRRVFLADDLDAPEQVGHARIAHLGLLVEQVALGDQHHRSEEHTSELQSLMRISYAVFCLKKKTKVKHNKI